MSSLWPARSTPAWRGHRDSCCSLRQASTARPGGSVSGIQRSPPASQVTIAYVPNQESVFVFMVQRAIPVLLRLPARRAQARDRACRAVACRDHLPYRETSPTLSAWPQPIPHRYSEPPSPTSASGVGGTLRPSARPRRCLSGASGTSLGKPLAAGQPQSDVGNRGAAARMIAQSCRGRIRLQDDADHEMGHPCPSRHGHCRSFTLLGQVGEVAELSVLAYDEHGSIAPLVKIRVQAATASEALDKVLAVFQEAGAGRIFMPWRKCDRGGDCRALHAKRPSSFDRADGSLRLQGAVSSSSAQAR